MSVRDQLMQRRYGAKSSSMPRRVAIYMDGRVYQGWASAHRTRSGRLYNLRLRLRRRFKTDTAGWE